MAPLDHTSLSAPKWHLNRFSCFCRAYPFTQSPKILHFTMLLNMLDSLSKNVPSCGGLGPSLIIVVPWPHRSPCPKQTSKPVWLTDRQTDRKTTLRVTSVATASRALSGNSNNCCLLYFNNANIMCSFTKKLQLLGDFAPAPTGGLHPPDLHFSFMSPQ